MKSGGGGLNYLFRIHQFFTSHPELVTTRSHKITYMTKQNELQPPGLTDPRFGGLRVQFKSSTMNFNAQICPSILKNIFSLASLGINFVFQFFLTLLHFIFLSYLKILQLLGPKSRTNFCPFHLSTLTKFWIRYWQFILRTQKGGKEIYWLYDCCAFISYNNMEGFFHLLCSNYLIFLPHT